MSRRTQRLDILTAAGLAQSDRDRELRAGEREAATTDRWAGALSSLIPAATNAAGAVYDTVGDEAVNNATSFAAQHNDVVDAEEARSLVDANPDLAEKTDGGILDNLMRPVRAKARAAATTALSSSAKANTATRAATAKDDADRALRNDALAATTTARQATADNAAKKTTAEELERKRTDAANAARGSMQQGMGRAELERLAASVNMTPEALLLRADETSTAANLARSKTQSEVTKNEALAKKAATPKPGPSAASVDRRAKQDKKLDLEIAALEGKATDSSDLRGEFSKLPAVKAYNDVAISFDKMQRSAASPSPAGDMALVFSFMKMLDPGSTVREGEFANAQNAGGIDTKIANAYNKALKGEILDEGQRKDFLAQAAGFLASQKRARDAAAAQFSRLAEKKGAAAEDVVGAGGDDGIETPDEFAGDE